MIQPTKDMLDILACEVDARPVGAPGIDALTAAIQGIERTGPALVVLFAADALETVERFVAAERQCCASIRWDVEVAPALVRLRVGAEPERLDALEGIFRQARF